jgi:F-type H+-transporting ATPase subunit b
MNNSAIIKEIIVQILGFGIVFLVLRKFAWKNLLGSIDLRRQKIEDEFAGISKTKFELENLEKEYRARLAHIEEEARLKMHEAANLGLVMAKDIQEKARHDSENLIARAKAEIDHDLSQAKLKIRDEIVEVASMISEKVLKEKLSAKDHERLVADFLKEMEQIR